MTDMLCPECRHIGPPERRKRGSPRLEVFAWLLFPFGLPYTLWRMFSRYPVCEACGEEMLIVANGPVGRRLRGLQPMDEKDDMGGAGFDPGMSHAAAIIHDKPRAEPPPDLPARPESRRHFDPDAW